MKLSFGKGLIAGLVGGAVYGLLTTKRSGEENRAILTDYANDVQRDFQVVQQDINKLTSLTNQIKNVNVPQVQAFGEEVQTSVEELERYSKPRIRDIQARSAEMQSYTEAQANKLNPNN